MGDRVLGFPATLEAYEQALADLQAALDEHGVRAKGRYNVELVFEEIVCNIIEHGRAGNGERAIEVAIGFEGDVVVMSFYDSGPQFDPCRHPIPEKPRLARKHARRRIGSAARAPSGYAHGVRAYTRKTGTISPWLSRQVKARSVRPPRCFLERVK